MSGVLDRLRFRRDHHWVPPRTSDYLDGELSRRERTRVDRHQRDCPECRELLRSLEAIVGALGNLRGDDSELVADTVLAAVQSSLRGLPRNGA